MAIQGKNNTDHVVTLLCYDKKKTQSQVVCVMALLLDGDLRQLGQKPHEREKITSVH